MDMGDDEYDEQITTAVEEEEVAIISTPPRKPTLRSRRRGSTRESWFPLPSFIDFMDDDMPSWNWRNFIEVGGAS